ncbi:MAG: outer membrane lipoprotein-sorting protein [Spirochaetaceae bacterium]|nr:outer membrane lipoprotein-sorting protein [Spirochaetaceae bacterium]
MKNRLLIVMTILTVLAPSLLSALTGEEIVRKADDMQIFETSEATGEMIIKDRFGTKVSTFNSWSRGSEESLIEFTSRAERGQKVLRTEDELYLFYPDAEELIRMQGSMLRQSMLGSDVSYEDMTGGKDRVSQYDVELLGEENVKGHDCYVLMMTANVRTVPYPKEKVWIDKETFLGWKAEYYTKSGRLLKEIEILKVEDFDGRLVATETRISDKMKTDTETIMILHDLKIDIPIDDNMFSLEELSW